MEKQLTRKELLENLIQQLQDPFCTLEKYDDIRTILLTSDTFFGLNHLFLAKLFIEDDAPFLNIDEEEARKQLELAIKEGNKNAYYFFYLFYKKTGDYTKARNYLRISYDLSFPDALMAMGKESMEGGLFQKDMAFAYACFRKAILAGKKEGYYYLVLIDTMAGNTQKAKDDYQKAMADGYFLPGVIE